ncbi:MAG: hypothetical protein QXV46_05470, partial [Candidatus Bathyarchaeia archaeon]
MASSLRIARGASNQGNKDIPPPFEDSPWRLPIRLQTFIIVTHDPSISQRTDRTIHMKDGIIVGEEPSTSSTVSQKRLFKEFSSSLPAD